MRGGQFLDGNQDYYIKNTFLDSDDDPETAGLLRLRSLRNSSEEGLRKQPLRYSAETSEVAQSNQIPEWPQGEHAADSEQVEDEPLSPGASPLNRCRGSSRVQFLETEVPDEGSVPETLEQFYPPIHNSMMFCNPIPASVDEQMRSLTL